MSVFNVSTTGIDSHADPVRSEAPISGIIAAVSSATRGGRIHGESAHELVGCEVTFLPEKDVDDEVALAGALAACRPQAVYVGRGGIHPGSCARRTGRRARWPVTP